MAYRNDTSQGNHQQPTETDALLPSHNDNTNTSSLLSPPSPSPSPSNSSSSSSLSTLLPEPKSCSFPSHSNNNKYYSSSTTGTNGTPWAVLVRFLRQLVGVDDTRRSNVSTHARMVSDAIIGLSDGLTVPFALTAGLSSVDGIAARTIVYGGLAELIAGAISMGLGGYLGAVSEVQSWRETRRAENIRAAAEPEEVARDVRSVFERYAGVSETTLDALVRELEQSSSISSCGQDDDGQSAGLVDFVMEFHHGTPEPSAARALQSALMIALGYIMGGIIPLLPYFFVQQQGGSEGGRDILWALYVSVGVMAVALFVFGYVKTCVFTGWRSWRCVRHGTYGGLQMVVVGGAAAGSAVALVKIFEGFGE